MQHPDTMFVKRKSDGLEHLINVEDFNDDLHLRATTALTPPKGKKVEPVVTPTPAPVVVPTGNEPPLAGDDQGDASNEGNSSGDGTDDNDAGSQQTGNDGGKPTLSVDKVGSKFFVIDQFGNKHNGEGINAKGYKTDAEAWAAVMAVAG